MSTLERALEIAASAHKGQTQKNTVPYILHPLHLVQQVETIEEKIVALLHDAVEDSDLTLADLRSEGFAEEIITAIALLTRNSAQSYAEYIENIRHNGLARAVKLADLRHNMDITRIEELTGNDLKRLQKYHAAWKKLRYKTKTGEAVNIEF